MAEQRRIAGLWCGEVLERLGAYVDGELSNEERAQVDAHLAECTWCESFGARYAETIGALARELSRPDPLPDDRKERLHSRIEEAHRGSGD